MKYSLLLTLVLCISCTFAYERLWAKGDILLAEMQNGRDELHVIVFYDSTNTADSYSKVRENQAVTNEVLKYLDTISEEGTDPFPTKVYYATIDAVDPYNQNIMYKAGIDPKELDNGPTILVTRQGKGFRQNGPKVVAALRDSVVKLKEVATQ
jgi:hypothetical protein